MTVEAIKPRFGQKLTQTAWLTNHTLGKETVKQAKLNAAQINLLISLRIDRRIPLSFAGQLAGATSQKERTALLLPLYEQGYITTVPFPNESGIELTNKGEEALHKALPMIEKAESLALKGFKDDEKQKLFEFLERIQTNCAS